MNENKLNLDQVILALLFLGFDKITNLDINLFVESFLKQYPNYTFEKLKLTNLKELLREENITINLNNGNIATNVKNKNEILQFILKLMIMLKKCLCKDMLDFINAFDLEIFTLRKIKHFSKINLDNINNLFCDNEQNAISKLIWNENLIVSWNDEIPYVDYQEISITKKGEVRLFIEENIKEINIFLDSLKSANYDTSLLNDFLLTQNLDQPIWSILSLEKLTEYCNDYDRALHLKLY